MPVIERKPRIYMQGGRWYVACKHGQAIGPYFGLSWAMLTARMLWEEYGPHAR